MVTIIVWWAVGAQIWGFIENGAPVHDIIDKVKCDYENNGTDIDEAVNKFVSELRQEGLTVPDNSRHSRKFSMAR